MELIGKEWENYSTPSIDNNNKGEHDKYWRERRLSTVSLGELKEKVNWMIQNAVINKFDPYEVPFFLKFDNKEYCVHTFMSGASSDGVECSSYDELKFTAPDSRPADGEYWKTRGCGTGMHGKDCSGFVKSKLAGERLRRMVNLIVEKDETDSYLDYRELEPNWIQYKFSDTEFDVEKLSDMSEDNNGIVTMQMLKDCKR